MPCWGPPLLYISGCCYAAYAYLSQCLVRPCDHIFTWHCATFQRCEQETSFLLLKIWVQLAKTESCDSHSVFDLQRTHITRTAVTVIKLQQRLTIAVLQHIIQLAQVKGHHLYFIVCVPHTFSAVGLATVWFIDCRNTYCWQVFILNTSIFTHRLIFQGLRHAT